MRVPLLTCATFACVLLTPLTARAQGRRNGLAISPTSALSFGTVIAGYGSTIAPTDAGAASFLITGPKGSQAMLTFRLPATLVQGAATLPITFGASAAAWASSNLPTNGTFFDPAKGIQMTIPNNRKVYVWMGGTIFVAPAQPAGTYTETITLSVVLN